jgi:hypothetical protein
MPSGDGQRTWFPEMIVREWHSGPIRTRFEGQTHPREKAWAEYRERHRLDIERNAPSHCPRKLPALTIIAEVGSSARITRDV